MKTTFKAYVAPRYELFVEQVRSYCQVTGVPFVMPTLSQFLEINGMTRNRLEAAQDGKPSAA